MADNRVVINVLIISTASVLITLFTYIFVAHHLDTPDRVQRERSALLGEHKKITEHINPSN